MNDDNSAEILKQLRALVLLQLANAENGNGSRKVELLLSRAGFTLKEIASVIGKKESTVGVAIHRAKINERKRNANA